MVPRFGSIGEMEQALAVGAIGMHSKIKARFRTRDADGNDIVQRVVTTPGRMILSEILPRHPAVPFSLINRLLTKKEITSVLDVVYRHCGQKETVIFADRMMQTGFAYACRAGISFGKDDMVIPKAKAQLVSEASERVKEYENQYLDRSEEHTSELQSLMRISYAVFCLKK